MKPKTNQKAFLFFRERAAVSVAIAKMGTAIRIAIKDHYQVSHNNFKKNFQIQVISFEANLRSFFVTLLCVQFYKILCIRISIMSQRFYLLALDPELFVHVQPGVCSLHHRPNDQVLLHVSLPLLRHLQDRHPRRSH